MEIEREGALETRIRADQLADLRTGLLFSMPISTVLSVLILLVQLVSGNGFAATIWFLVVNAVNVPRLALALRRFSPESKGRSEDSQATSRQLRLYSVLALLSGLAWSFLAVLTDGFTTPQASLHLIILAGISAGAVTYGSSYAAPPINFITPPLLTTGGCIAVMGGFDNYIFAFAVLLFYGGMVRSALLGQARFREISRLKHEAGQIAEEMELRSRQDPLTGLLNRRGLEHAVDGLRNAGGPFVTMLIDLDGFKSVNDTYGHKIGDDLLARIARRIEKEVPDDATLARIGGDEFVVLFPSTANSRSPTELASRIIANVASPYSGLASIRIGASIGVYLSDKLRLTEMLLRADIALYTAKCRGRNEFCLFNRELDAALHRRQCIERDLREAIETGSLSTWFQPFVTLDKGAVVGFEALLRWLHPVHGAISPPEIVTAARETGMLQLLTETVFLGCCSLIDDLVKADCREIRVAMNVSPRELEAGNIDDLILNGLEVRNLPTTMFEIEITEEAPVDPDRVDEKLGRLSHAGISIALDDFGTGFSTLASLKDRRISKVKIDQAFIRNLAGSREDQLLVQAVIGLGEMLGIEVMAEGVETEANRKALQALGCKTAQGFLFSRAVLPREALEMSAKEHSNLQ